MPLPARAGPTLDSRLLVAEGGVRGREFGPETELQRSAYEQRKERRKLQYRESSLRISACE
jgi:hypothetical protein